MNPDKLFDYLEDKLPAAERAALEQRLMSDKQLQRELAVARQIHAGMRGDSREVLLPPQPDVTEQGRKMALRVGAAFIVLMAVNVGIGLWLIARHETKNPNRALLEKQMREQIANSLEHAAATFTPAPLGVSEIMVPAATEKLIEACRGANPVLDSEVGKYLSEIRSLHPPQTPGAPAQTSSAGQAMNGP